MNKTELFHLHSLLAAVAEDFADRESLADADLDDYRELGTSQFDVQAARDAHGAAVLTLAQSLSAVAERDAGKGAERDVVPAN